MGKGLQRLTRAQCGKLPVVITEGNIKAVVPLVAAKFATKCNIAVRIHVPVLTHWKEYKKQPAQFNLFMGRLCVSTFSRLVLQISGLLLPDVTCTLYGCLQIIIMLMMICLAICCV